MTTHDDATLARDYAAAHYRVDVAAGTFELHVGECAHALEDELPALTYGFITAWNPRSVPRSAQANRAAESDLDDALTRAGVRAMPACACDAAGGWREPGWLVMDVASDALDALGRRFGQAGVLFWRAGVPVGLRMLLPRPVGAAPHAWTDWVE